mgnify:FL=1|jgi:hypothetical protein
MVFTNNESDYIKKVLTKIQRKIAPGDKINFSLSKRDDIYTGVLKVIPQNIFSFAKDISLKNLFSKIMGSVEWQIAQENRHEISELDHDNTIESKTFEKELKIKKDFSQGDLHRAWI